MARLTDHETRDAEHALRCEITLILMRYSRRMLSNGKAHIVEAIAEAVKNGDEIDGTAIGRTAAQRVTAEYFAISRPKEAVGIAATSVSDEPATGGGIAGPVADDPTSDPHF